METEKLHFRRRKYGEEILIDCSLFSLANINLRKNPFILGFNGIYIITKGNGSIRLDNKLLPFKAGTLLFFQPGQIRQWQDVSSDFDGYFLVFENEFIATFFQDSLFVYRFQYFHNSNVSATLFCNKDFFNTLLSICKLINNELKNLREDSHHLLRSLLYTILVLINREFVKQIELPVNITLNTDGLKFKKLIETSIRRYHKVDYYADSLKISRSHLNNISKINFGQTSSFLIKERLLIEVKRELLFTNNSIKDICYNLNFSDVPNFIRFFKKHTGINPNQFRLMNSK